MKPDYSLDFISTWDFNLTVLHLYTVGNISCSYTLTMSVRITTSVTYSNLRGCYTVGLQIEMAMNVTSNAYST